MSSSSGRRDNDNGIPATTPGLRTDVTNPSETREELIRLVEDLDEADENPEAFDTAEARLTQLLSDVRRARKHAYATGGDA